MSKYQFGFIGTGSMGSALATAVCRRVAPEQVILSNRTPVKAEDLASRLGCCITVDNATVGSAQPVYFPGRQAPNDVRPAGSAGSDIKKAH